jgi:hypothetical protein
VAIAAQGLRGAAAGNGLERGPRRRWRWPAGPRGRRGGWGSVVREGGGHGHGHGSRDESPRELGWGRGAAGLASCGVSRGSPASPYQSWTEGRSPCEPCAGADARGWPAGWGRSPLGCPVVPSFPGAPRACRSCCPAVSWVAPGAAPCLSPGCLPALGSPNSRPGRVGRKRDTAHSPRPGLPALARRLLRARPLGPEASP